MNELRPKQTIKLYTISLTLIYIILLFFKKGLDIVVELLFLIGAVLNVYNYGAIYDKNQKNRLSFSKDDFVYMLGFSLFGIRDNFFAEI